MPISKRENCDVRFVLLHALAKLQEDSPDILTFGRQRRRKRPKRERGKKKARLVSPAPSETEGMETDVPESVELSRVVAESRPPHTTSFQVFFGGFANAKSLQLPSLPPPCQASWSPRKIPVNDYPPRAASLPAWITKNELVRVPCLLGVNATSWSPRRVAHEVVVTRENPSRHGGASSRHSTPRSRRHTMKAETRLSTSSSTSS